MTTPKEVAANVVAQYSFVLNTPESRGRDLTGKEFAARIAKVFDCSEHSRNKYATIIAEDYIANIRYDIAAGLVAWKFKGNEA